MRTHARLTALTLVTSMALTSGLAEACGSFVLRNNDKSFVYAWTFEFGFSLEEQLALIPRNHEFKGVGPDGVEGTGLNWTGKYAILGTRIFGLPVVIDGINEKGLTGGMLYAPT